MDSRPGLETLDPPGRNHHQAGKSQAESDLHSINCPYERLGAIADAASRLPGTPEYVEPEPQSTKNPVTREARVHGMIRFAEKTMQTAEKKGVPWRTALQGDGAGSPKTANLKAEWENVRKRLAALGEDLDEIAENIASGDIEVTQEFEADVPPDDPELQRVYAAWAKDRQAAGPPDEDEEAESAVGHEWLPERNEDTEVAWEPVGRVGPNGWASAASAQAEADTWDDHPVYNDWDDEEE